MTYEDELKECPFCGSVHIKLWGDENTPYWCQCQNCLASTVTNDDKAEAMKAWNKRK